MRIRFSVPEATDPRRDGGVQLPPQQARRVAPRWRWVFIVLLALSPALGVAGVLLRGWLWIEAGGFVVLEETPVTARYAGTVRELHVRNGASAAAGAPLLELEDAELRAEIEALDVSGRLAARSEAGPSGIEAQIAAVRALLEAQRGQASTLEALHANGAATRGEVLAALERADATQGELAALERERDRQRSEKVLMSTELASRAAVLAARARELRVEAPIGGTIDNLAIATGQNVEAGAELLVIRRGEPRVIAFLPGRELWLRAGAKVRIELPDGRSIPGDVLGHAPSTLRLPEELSGSFDQRTARLQVVLAPVGLPAEARVHRLPVTVSFFRFRL
jgi:multidrug resistance efflux pump